MGSSCEAYDFIYFGRAIRRTIDEFVPDADLEKRPVHDKASHRPPALGPRMGPYEKAPAGHCIVANRTDKMGCPYPGS